MTISVNGEKMHFDEKHMVLQSLLEKLNYKEGFAVALNRTFVLNRTYRETIVKEGDEVDILAPVQGG